MSLVLARTKTMVLVISPMTQPGFDRLAAQRFCRPWRLGSGIPCRNEDAFLLETRHPGKECREPEAMEGHADDAAEL